MPGGEYFPDWLPPAVDRLRLLVRSYEERSLICFTHFAVIKAAFVAFSGASAGDVDSIRPTNASITEWERLPAAAAEGVLFSLRRYNDASHLAHNHPADGVANPSRGG